jgi:NAD(P)-dependent dehydrogenase (short-subunit alcohol dehydrogenase family)
MNKSPVVVVTGASAGIGRAVVRELAKHNAKIGLIARGIDGLEGALHDALRDPRRGECAAPCTLAQADVADDHAVECAAAKIEAELGPIDIWINNAMVSVFARADEITPEEFRRVTEVTYLGYVWGTLAALRRMKPRGRGTIVQVGSALAYRSIPLQSAYCAAKHAIKGFTESLRTELLHDKVPIDLVMVELPAVNTPQFDWSRSRMPRRAQPVPPIFQPEVVAKAIVHAALHPRREVIVGETTALAIAAERIAPAIADRWLSMNGVDAQMTNEPATPAAPDNLFHPLPGDRGAHGRFDREARTFSLQAWANQHRKAIALAFGAVAAACGGALTVRALRSA